MKTPRLLSVRALGGSESVGVMVLSARRLLFGGLLGGVALVLLLGRFYAEPLGAWIASTNPQIDGDELDVPEKRVVPAEPPRLPKAPNRPARLPSGSGLGWPTLLGPMHDSSSPERGLHWDWPAEGPWEKWRIGVGTGYSSPVALGDAVVVLHRQGDQEVVECLDAETGKSRWRTSWPATYRCPFPHSSGPYSAPVLEAGRVYAIGAQGEAYCLRLEDGGIVWHRSLHKEYRVAIEVWPVAASPLVEADRLIINLGARQTGAGIIALDKATGKTLWTATHDGASCCTPRAATIHGQRHVVVWTADAVVSLDPASGTIRWRIPFAANNYEAAHGTSPLIAGELVLVSGYQIGNLCVRVRPDGSYQELWRDKRHLLDSQYTNLLHVDGTVCGFSCTRRKMRCLELTTGEMKWEWRSRIRTGNTIAVDGRCLVLGENGLLAVLRLSDHGATVEAITERPVLASPCLSYPALSNGLLYLRSEQEMVCIDLRPGLESP